MKIHRGEAGAVVLLSGLAMLWLTVVASPAAALPVEGKGGGVVLKEESLSNAVGMNEVFGSILWHRFMKMKESEKDLLDLHGVSLGNYDEFTRRKVVKETLSKHSLTERMADIVPVYSVAVDLELREYDFDRQGFPTTVNPGPLRIRVGKGIEVSSEKTFKDELRYFVNVNLPKGVEFLPKAEGEAETFAKRLQGSRAVAMRLWIVPTGGVAAEKGNDSPLVDRYYRGISGDLVRCDIVFPSEGGLPEVRLWRWEAGK
jgi:hypothetical protein